MNRLCAWLLVGLSASALLVLLSASLITELRSNSAALTSAQDPYQLKAMRHDCLEAKMQPQYHYYSDCLPPAWLPPPCVIARAGQACVNPGYVIGLQWRAVARMAGEAIYSPPTSGFEAEKPDTKPPK